jgi:hypothetical protein
MLLLLLSPGAAKVLGALGDYRIKYAAARAKQHPDMAAVYEAKIASMKNAGEQLHAVSPAQAAEGRGMLWSAACSWTPVPAALADASCDNRQTST